MTKPQNYPIMYTETSLFFLLEFNIMDGQARLLRCQIKEIRSVKEFLEHFNIERYPFMRGQSGHFQD